jgi:hypothetical protein
MPEDGNRIVGFDGRLFNVLLNAIESQCHVHFMMPNVMFARDSLKPKVNTNLELSYKGIEYSIALMVEVLKNVTELTPDQRGQIAKMAIRIKREYTHLVVIVEIMDDLLEHYPLVDVESNVHAN